MFFNSNVFLITNNSNRIHTSLPHRKFTHTHEKNFPSSQQKNAKPTEYIQPNKSKITSSNTHTYTKPIQPKKNKNSKLPKRPPNSRISAAAANLCRGASALGVGPHGGAVGTGARGWRSLVEPPGRDVTLAPTGRSAPAGYSGAEVTRDRYGMILKPFFGCFRCVESMFREFRFWYGYVGLFSDVLWCFRCDKTWCFRD